MPTRYLIQTDVRDASHKKAQRYHKHVSYPLRAPETSPPSRALIGHIKWTRHLYASSQLLKNTVYSSGESPSPNLNHPIRVTHKKAQRWACVGYFHWDFFLTTCHSTHISNLFFLHKKSLSVTSSFTSNHSISVYKLDSSTNQISSTSSLSSTWGGTSEASHISIPPTARSVPILFGAMSTARHVRKPGRWRSLPSPTFAVGSIRGSRGTEILQRGFNVRRENEYCGWKIGLIGSLGYGRYARYVDPRWQKRVLRSKIGLSRLSGYGRTARDVDVKYRKRFWGQRWVVWLYTISNMTGQGTEALQRGLSIGQRTSQIRGSMIIFWFDLVRLFSSWVTFTISS